MSITDDDIITAILLREGGFVDHPADRGGATNHGITQATLSDFLGKPATVDDVKELDEATARVIYQEIYVDAPGFKRVEDVRLRGLLVDCAVNHGPRRAVEMLQRAVGTKVDGVLGEKTLGALAENPAAIYHKLCAERVRFYGRIISRDHSQAVFAAGWMERVAEFIEESA